MTFTLIYLGSMAVCWFCIVTAFVQSERREDLRFCWWWDVHPFGMGYPALCGIAGFSIFPIINAGIAFAYLVWLALHWGERNEKHGSR